MNDKKVLVSFVVPVYNVENYLNQCIQSIISQTQKEWELILIDNGSTDTSGAICDRYARENEKIAVIHQENKGPASARNIGVRLAKGDWISFVDSDDWVEPDYIEKLQNYFNDEIELVFYAYDIVSENGRKIVLQKDARVSEITNTDIELLEKQSIDTGVEKENSVVAKYRGQVWTKLYRKQFLLENNLFARENLMRTQDVMFNLEVYGKAQKGIFVPEVLYHYRKLNSSLCHGFSVKQTEYLTTFVEEMGKYLDETGKREKYQHEYLIRKIFTLANCCFLNYCHPMNHKKYSERKQEFLLLCGQEIYADAICNTNLKIHMSMPKKIVAIAVKKKWFFILNMISLIEKKIKRA